MALCALHRRLLLMVAAIPAAASACQGGESRETPIFACEASHGKKYIELCFNDGYDAGHAAAPNEDSYLVYRFGSLDENQESKDVELEYPAKDENSFKKFFGATYSSSKWYTKSVRFVSGNFDYTVFSHWRSATKEEAADESSVAKTEGVEEDGVEIRNRKSGKKSYVWCSERPRFYLDDLKNLVGCDTETPAGTACIR